LGCGNKVRGDVGIDKYISPEERKKLHLGKSQVNLEPHLPIIKSTAEVLPFKNQTFEKSICYSSLEHCLNPYLVLLEIYRVLKNNGIVTIYIPNAETQHYKGNEDHLYCWSKHEIMNLLSRVNFEVEKITPFEEINMIVIARKRRNEDEN